LNWSSLYKIASSRYKDGNLCRFICAETSTIEPVAQCVEGSRFAFPHFLVI